MAITFTAEQTLSVKAPRAPVVKERTAAWQVQGSLLLRPQPQIKTATKCQPANTTTRPQKRGDQSLRVNRLTDRPSARREEAGIRWNLQRRLRSRLLPAWGLARTRSKGRHWPSGCFGPPRSQDYREQDRNPGRNPQWRRGGAC